MTSDAHDKQPASSESRIAPFATFAAWRCPWCERSNDRLHEGLDTCEHCGSEAKTQYHPTDNERLLVVIAYEPEKPQKSANDQAQGSR